MPDGSPTITYYGNNNSSQSIRLAWIPPPNSTINGELIGYKVKYRPRDRPDREKEISVADPGLRVSLF